jgi:hypothetical protein
MSNLIPQKRMDKTGKLVTRHVLASAPSGSTTAPIPAPSVKAPAKAGKTVLKSPLAKQLKVHTRMTNLSSLRPDPEVIDALGFTVDQVFPLISLRTNDVSLFDMFSVVSSSNAAVLMSHGIKIPDEAVRFLESKGLGHLIVDRREIMNKAQNLRVSAWNLMEAPHKFNVDELSCDADLLLKAVRLDDAVSLPRWENKRVGANGAEDSYAHQVMNGAISFDDVMSLGISFLSERASPAPKICEYLHDLHEGRANYDIRLLDHAVMKCRNNPSTLDDVMAMVTEYGPDLVMELHAFDSALIIDREYRSRPSSQRADMMRYQRDGGASFYDLSTKDIVRLFDSGAPVEKVKEMLLQGMSAEQMIGVHKEGISKSVSSGWL